MLRELLSRIPNTLEVAIGTCPQAGLEVLYDKEVERFSKNPIDKSLFRDVAGVPVALINAAIGSNIGSTKIKNDWLSSGGSLLQTTCKLSFIYPVLNNINSSTQELEIATKKANYICSPISSITSVVSKARQIEKKTDMFALSYMFYHANPIWGIKSFFGSMVSSACARTAGGYVKEIDYFTVIKHISFIYENRALNLLKKVGIVDYSELTSSFEDNVWLKIEKFHEDKINDPLYVGAGVLIGSSFLNKLMIEIANTYIIATAARFGSAYFDYILREDPSLLLVNGAIIVEPVISSYINSFFISEAINIESDSINPVEPDNKDAIDDGLREVEANRVVDALDSFVAHYIISTSVEYFFKENPLMIIASAALISSAALIENSTISDYVSRFFLTEDLNIGSDQDIIPYLDFSSRIYVNAVVPVGLSEVTEYYGSCEFSHNTYFVFDS
jgi:hypothetical protein